MVGGGATPAVRLDATRIAAVDDVWQSVARAKGLKLLDLDPTLCPGGQSNAALRPDGAHFDDNGSSLVGTMVAKAVHVAVAQRAALGID